MFAVIKTGGLQYCVTPGDVIKINKIEAEKNAIVAADEVLLCANEKETEVGRPALGRYKVNLQVIDQCKNDKVIIFKKHRRHNYRRKNGHRQPMTVVKVLEIKAEG